jgi:hypothetical protein
LIGAGMKIETSEELNFLINLVRAMILEFHRFEDRKRQIEQCSCPILDGSGYVLYSYTDLNRCVQISSHTTPTFVNNPARIFYHRPMANFRLELPAFLRWFWAGRLDIEAEDFGPGERWEGCDDEEWEAYLEEIEDYTVEQLIDHVMEQYINDMALYGIDCHFRMPYCPCAMVL